MSDLLPDGHRVPVRICSWQPMLLTIVSGLAASSATGALASDAGLQRALLEAGCAKAEVRPLPRLGAAEIYRADCFGSSHKVIEVVCVDGRCAASQPRHRRDEVPC